VHVKATTSADNCGPVSNTASASATNEKSTDTGNNSATASVTVLCPDIKVEKTADAASVSAGDQIGFTVKVSNIGSGNAVGLTFTDTLPAGLTWTIDPASTGWSIAGGNLVYTPTTLAAGASTTVHVKATTSSNNCGSVSNTASASATNEKASDTTNNTATASVTVLCPDLVVSKLADASPVNAGQPIGFKITVTNSGLGQAKGVTLSDTLPGNPGMTWTIDPNPLFTDPTCTITGGNILNCTFGDINSTATKKVHVTSPTIDANCGSVTNTATASATNERASDTANNSSTASIVLNDATAPTINTNGQLISLWSPNHKYVTYKPSDFVTTVSDSCQGNIPVSNVWISKVTSDEPENINSGDGNTFNDMVIANDCKSVDLRAERDGNKNGRVYTITLKAKDAQGNVATTTVKVTVPHSQGPKGVAVDDGPVYTVVNPNCP